MAIRMVERSGQLEETRPLIAMGALMAIIVTMLVARSVVEMRRMLVETRLLATPRLWSWPSPNLEWRSIGEDVIVWRCTALGKVLLSPIHVDI